MRYATWTALALLASAGSAAAREAASAGDAGAAWLAGLQDGVAKDLLAGRPLVIETHVALCDNRIIPCGNLGNGDRPDRNLYWATSGGMVGWMSRKGSGWKQVLKRGQGSGAEADVLELRVWHRRMTPGEAFRARGVSQPFDVYLVARAWRGTAIDSMLEAYVADLYGHTARDVELPDGTVLHAGGAAHVVGYVGHNRWMDRDAYDFAAAARAGGSAPRPKGTVTVACHTDDYLGAEVPAADRVPLLFTSDFMFAGSHAYEGAARAFAEGKTLKQIRATATEQYAAGQKRDVNKIRGAFTNPADPRWRKRH